MFESSNSSTTAVEHNRAPFEPPSSLKNSTEIFTDSHKKSPNQNKNSNKSPNQNKNSNKNLNLKVATASHPTPPNLKNPNVEPSSSNLPVKNKRPPKSLRNKKDLPTKKKEKKHQLRKSHDKTKNQPTWKGL
jgi:hypothetical protein